MEKYIQYVENFHENNQKEIEFLNKFKEEIREKKQTEIEEILDFLYSNKEKDFSQIGYNTIKEKKDKWHKMLAKKNITDEVEGVDFDIVKDFSDGFKFVKLKSENSFNTEGKKMSHCVASYYWRNDVVIYSLRDTFNNPHCTIEEGQQIKGKGNGKISPKYIKYVVEFLESLNMEMREYEMKNLWYEPLDIYKNLLKDWYKSFRTFIYEDDIDKFLKDDVEVVDRTFILNNYC